MIILKIVARVELTMSFNCSRKVLLLKNLGWIAQVDWLVVGLAKFKAIVL